MIHIKSQHKDLNSAKSQKIDCSDCMSNIDHNKHRKAKKLCLLASPVNMKQRTGTFWKDWCTDLKLRPQMCCVVLNVNLRQQKLNFLKITSTPSTWMKNAFLVTRAISNRAKRVNFFCKHKGSTTAQMKTLECTDCQMDIKHSKCSPLFKKEKKKGTLQKEGKNMPTMFLCDLEACIFEGACSIISWPRQRSNKNHKLHNMWVSNFNIYEKSGSCKLCSSEAKTLQVQWLWFKILL